MKSTLPSLRWRVFYAGRLAQFVRSQHQMMHIPKTGFIVGNRPAEGAERSHQDLTAIEIGTHMVEYAMQLELYSIYSRLRSHSLFPLAGPCQRGCRM